jgi:hypothetical protein
MGGFEILSPLNCRSLPPHPTKAIFQQELPKMMAEIIGVFFETESDFNSCLKPNDISNLVNNCLADIPLGKFALYANERPLENLGTEKGKPSRAAGQGPCSTNSHPDSGSASRRSLARELFIPAVAARRSSPRVLNSSTALLDLKRF